jgi:hypothetical protein
LAGGRTTVLRVIIIPYTERLKDRLPRHRPFNLNKAAASQHTFPLPPCHATPLHPNHARYTYRPLREAFPATNQGRANRHRAPGVSICNPRHPIHREPRRARAPALRLVWNPLLCLRVLYVCVSGACMHCPTNRHFIFVTCSLWKKMLGARRGGAQTLYPNPPGNIEAGEKLYE